MTSVPADTAWAGYLDALEGAVRAMDEQLLAGGTPVADELAGLAVPAVPMPRRFADRKQLLVAMLHDVTGRAVARREVIAAELAALPRRRPGRGQDSPATLGGTLDVVG